MLLCVACWLGSAGAEQGNTVRIDSIKALLFNAKTGGFSDDVLASGAAELGNVPASSFASKSTFVIVRVNLGPNQPVSHPLRVRLVATDLGRIPAVRATKQAPPRRVLLDQTARLGPVNPQGQSHVGFWLDDTGCDTVELNAKVVGGTMSAAPMTATLAFACYE
jgi:hypothetical protein